MPKHWPGSIRATLFLLASMLSASPLNAEVYSADSVKAVFLHRFASYVEWPPDSAAGRFVIAVAGAEEVAKELDALLPRMTVHGKPAEVRRVTRTSELEDVQILYIGADALARTRGLRTAALKRPILIVTDDKDGLDAGAVINFLDSGRHVRFEVSLIAADRARLKIDSALLSVAARVERRPQTAVPAVNAAGVE